MKYRCLILDHDDTAVDSTAEIHHPAHVEVMKQLRPGQEPASLDEWFRKNFNPGIMVYLKEELGFNEEEIQIEYGIWREFTLNKTPHFFPGFLDLVREFKNRGGIVTVVSHSEREMIQRHYEMTEEPGREALIPDSIFGWTMVPEERKPHPFPVHCILEEFNLSPEDVLVVDDLKPGVDMAKAADVAVAAAGWSHQIPEIVHFMKKNCHVYCSSIGELGEYLFN
ncbi:MAG: hydrolase [Acidobacteria bacterium]|nr:MAG: hydrolase [Acidobacteriota bacterium]